MSWSRGWANAARSAIVCVWVVSAAACGSSKSEEDPRTLTPLVAVATVEVADNSERSFTGLVAARVQSNLTFRVAGKVVERQVDTGEVVRRGQPLMRLDPTDYGHIIASHSASLEAARARSIQATADEERYRGLVASGAVSQSSYDQVKAAADSARALLSAAEAQLKVAQDEGDYSVLRADADGTVIDTLAEPGQFVGAGQIVIRLARSGPREALVNLPETLRPKLGSSAYVTLYNTGLNESRYRARLRQLSDAADPATRTFEARYVLDGEGANAPLGTTVTVSLAQVTPKDVLAVPFSAIDDEGRGPGVWVIDRESLLVSFRPVRFTRFGGENALVTEGVRVGEKIVATGGHYLHEGMRVRPGTLQAAMQ